MRIDKVDLGPNGQIDTKLLRYMVKRLSDYAVKQLNTDTGKKLKPLCYSARCRRSNLKWKWNPENKPEEYLFEVGKRAHFEMFLKRVEDVHWNCSYRDRWAYLVTLGAEWTNWREGHPQWVPPEVYDD